MTEVEAIKMFNDLLDVPCEMLIKYDSVINSEKKQALVRLRTAEEIAISALEKQIPKKPRFYAHNYYCSVCDNLVCQRFKYCDNCGRKLDWNK